MFMFSVKTEPLNKEHLRALIQAIRDCEVANFPDKDIHVFLQALELGEDEITELLESIKPPYKYGPIVLKHKGGIGQMAGGIQPNDHIRIGEIAKYCGVEPNTVRRWVKSGKLAAKQLPSRHFRVSIEDLKAFLERYNHPVIEENED